MNALVLYQKQNVPARVTDDDEDVKHTRLSIPGQQHALQRFRVQFAAAERLQIAEARFGLSQTRDALSDAIARTLPLRPFRFRTTEWTIVEKWDRGVLPDDAVRKYLDAQRSGLFDRFDVVEPLYKEHARNDDPWLVGRVRDTGRYIVLAYWAG